ncbi:hypothetical protein COF68_05255 [Bacillus toyonensis]|uniref:hypothetical protein n=1 Tax=Bacillus toyonensis TaxID=155322 RepID=UPI000BFBBBD5|nr:hypothetical protein [Bacillus toyonensis]PHE64251.1 hypothetical protein COF68_05255 [Bacillus toyonensis]
MEQSIYDKVYEGQYAVVRTRLGLMKVQIAQVNDDETIVVDLMHGNNYPEFPQEHIVPIFTDEYYVVNEKLNGKTGKYQLGDMIGMIPNYHKELELHIKEELYEYASNPENAIDINNFNVVFKTGQEVIDQYFKKEGK